MMLNAILCAICVFGALVPMRHPTPWVDAFLWSLAALNALCAVRAA